MKKKLLSLMLASALALGVAGGLSACGPEPAPEVTGITIDSLVEKDVKTIELAPDDHFGLRISYTPSGSESNITWTSSDEKVALVNGGYVTAVNTGTATITATTENGKSDTCQIVVGEWTYYAAVGSCFADKEFKNDAFQENEVSWNPYTTKWVMKQDATDMHKWTITADLPKDAEFKFVPCVKKDGVWMGGGWATSFGCDNKEANATIVEGGSETNMLGSDNIKVEYAGNYTLTLITKVGGGVDKLMYVRNGDITPAA